MDKGEEVSGVCCLWVRFVASVEGKEEEAAGEEERYQKRCLDPYQLVGGDGVSSIPVLDWNQDWSQLWNERMDLCRQS